MRSSGLAPGLRRGHRTEDPLGFEAGDANFYRFVGNDPTNLTDPSGLVAPPKRTETKGGVVVKLKNLKFAFDDGYTKGAGTVSVVTGVSYKGPTDRAFTSDGIQFSVKTDFLLDGDWHWIQRFRWSHRNDKDVEKSPDSTYLMGKRDPERNVDLLAHFVYGEWYLDHNRSDTSDPNLVYYDARYSRTIRTANELTIFDKPEDRDRRLRKGEKVVFTGDTCLVHNGGIYYRVVWERVGTYSDKGPLERNWSYRIVSAGPTNVLPDWLTAPSFISGYGKLDVPENIGEVTGFLNPFIYPNPVRAKRVSP
jgi:hypothetical protein